MKKCTGGGRIETKKKEGRAKLGGREAALGEVAEKRGTWPKQEKKDDTTGKKKKKKKKGGKKEFSGKRRVKVGRWQKMIKGLKKTPGEKNVRKGGDLATERQCLAANYRDD